jgi:hypothetical protein
MRKEVRKTRKEIWSENWNRWLREITEELLKNWKK